MATILDGVRVLDLGRFMAAPYCGVLLADMGAEVIRIEKPEGEWDRRLGGSAAPSGDTYMFAARSRGKKGVTLDLQSAEGREILHRLVGVSDVVLENFATEAKPALGVDYPALRAANPRIVVTSLTAFGTNGPYASRLGMDGVAQAMCGAMATSGFPGNPPTKSFLSWVDYCAAVHAALGTVLALHHREKTGIGQLVDVSLFDTAVNLTALSGMVGDYTKADIVQGQMGNGSASGYSDCLRTSDGWVMVITHGPLWRRFLRAIGKPEIASDPRFGERERSQHHHLLNGLVSPWFAERTVEEVLRLMEEARIPCGKVNGIADVVGDPQVEEREMLVEVQHGGGTAPVGGIVVKLSETPGHIQRGTPGLGEHNEEVLCTLLGLSPSQLAALQERGIV